MYIWTLVQWRLFSGVLHDGPITVCLFVAISTTNIMGS